MVVSHHGARLAKTWNVARANFLAVDAEPEAVRALKARRVWSGAGSGSGCGDGSAQGAQSSYNSMRDKKAAWAGATARREHFGGCEPC